MAPRITGDRSLVVGGRNVLTLVPGNVTLRPVVNGPSEAAFVGARAVAESDRHVFTLGVLEGFRLVCLFRFKPWWMIPRFGKFGSDVPLETQMLLLEVNKETTAYDTGEAVTASEKTCYVLFLPVLEADFRASLQGNSQKELQLCLESGDPNVKTATTQEALFINSADNPYNLIKDSVKFLAKHKGSFCHLETKKIPELFDWFGWCTWDAFYKEVDPQGIQEGLQSFSEGGIPPRFLVIDDGWQDTVNYPGRPECAARLVHIQESAKFRNNISTAINSDLGEFIAIYSDFGEFIATIKEKFGLKYVYMWLALLGVWGGVLPSSEEMMKYDPKLIYPLLSPGNAGNIKDIVVETLETYGVGMVSPTKVHDFYNDIHSYLASKGVDGIKVDVQTLIETLGSGYGGRVSLTRKFHGALEESVARNFKDNAIICSMSLSTDCLYNSKKTAVARASEDFFPKELDSQLLHIANVSFSSLLLGEILLPDWDMFQTQHNSAEFHSAARAVGGCGVYVSDKPGCHDFSILKRLVLPDGSILRAKHTGRPTRDCLFLDPVMGGKSLLKIWNLNKFSGVVGVFNCQGGTWPLMEKGPSSFDPLNGHVRPSDVEFLDELAGESWTGDFAVYAFISGRLSRLTSTGSMDVTLCPLHCEVCTISPIKLYNQACQFAPIGLIEMYNSGGFVNEISSVVENTVLVICIKGRGCGLFGAYSDVKPSRCEVDAEEAEFNYDEEQELLTFALPFANSSRELLKVIKIFY